MSVKMTEKPFAFTFSRKPAGRVGWSWICEWNEKGGVGGGGWREDPKTRYSLPSPGDVPLGNQVTVGYRFPPGRGFWGFMWEHLGCCRWPFSYPTWHSPCWMLPVICHGSQPGGWAEVEFANEMRKGVWGGADGRIQKIGIPCGGACAGGRPVRVMYHSAIRWRWGIDSPQDADFEGLCGSIWDAVDGHFSYPTWHSPCWMLPVVCFLFCGLWSCLWLVSPIFAVQPHTWIV